MTENEKLDLILEKVTVLDERVTILDKKVTILDKRITVLEQDMVDVKADLKQLHCNDRLILDEVERVHTIVNAHTNDTTKHTA